MPKVDLYTLSGQKSGKVDLPKEIFDAQINEPLMAQAVRVYLGNQRMAGAKVKTRGEVKGSRRKIWRQKGTGRARHGDRYAPIFVGGGRAHGPTGQENYQRKLSKKMRKKALFSALSARLKEGQVLVVKGLGKIEPKTKKMNLFLGKITNSKEKEQKITLVLPAVLENVIRSARNIKGAKLAQANLLSTYQVLNGGKLVLMEESIEAIKQAFLGKKKKESLKAKGKR